MFNSTTIGAGLGSSPNRLLAWGLGWTETTVSLVGILNLYSVGLSYSMLTNIRIYNV